MRFGELILRCLALIFIFKLVVENKILDESPSQYVSDASILNDVCELSEEENSTQFQEVYSFLEQRFIEMDNRRKNYKDKYVRYNQLTVSRHQLEDKIMLPLIFQENMTNILVLNPIISFGGLMQSINERIIDIITAYTGKFNTPDLDEAQQIASNLKNDQFFDEIEQHRIKISEIIKQIHVVCGEYMNLPISERHKVMARANALEVKLLNELNESNDKITEKLTNEKNNPKIVDDLNESLEQSITLITTQVNDFYNEASKLFSTMYLDNINNPQTIPTLSIYFDFDKYLNIAYQWYNDIDEIEWYLENKITSRENDIINNHDSIVKFINNALDLANRLEGHLKVKSVWYDLTTYGQQIMNSLGEIIQNNSIDIVPGIDDCRSTLRQLEEKLNHFKKLNDRYQNINTIKMNYLKKLKNLAQTDGYSKQLLETHYAYELDLIGVRGSESYLTNEQLRHDLFSMATDIENKVSNLKRLVATTSETLETNIYNLKDSTLRLQRQMDLVNETIYRENHAYLDARIFSNLDGEEKTEFTSNIDLTVEKMTSQSNRLVEIKNKQKLLSTNYHLLHSTYILQANNITQHNEFYHPFNITLLRSTALLALKHYHRSYTNIEAKLLDFMSEYRKFEARVTLAGEKMLELESEVEVYKQIRNYSPSTKQIKDIRNYLVSHLNDHPESFHSLVDSSVKQLFGYKYNDIVLEKEKIKTTQKRQQDLDDQLSSINDLLEALEQLLEQSTGYLSSTSQFISENLSDLHQLDAQYSGILQRLNSIQHLVKLRKKHFSIRFALVDKKINPVLTQIYFQYHDKDCPTHRYQSLLNELTEQKNDIQQHMKSLVEFCDKFYGIDCSAELTEISDTILSQLDSQINSYLKHLSNLNEEASREATVFSQYKIKHLNLFNNTINTLTRIHEQSIHCQFDISLATNMSELENVSDECEKLLNSYSDIDSKFNSTDLEMDSLLTKIEQFDVHRTLLLDSTSSTTNMNSLKSTVNHIKQLMDSHLQNKYHKDDYEGVNSLFRHIRFIQLYESIKIRYNRIKKFPQAVTSVSPPEYIAGVIDDLTRNVNEYVERFHKLRETYTEKDVKLWDKPFNIISNDFYYRIITYNFPIVFQNIMFELWYGQLVDMEQQIKSLYTQIHSHFGSIELQYSIYNQVREHIIQLVNDKTVTNDEHNNKIHQLVGKKNLAIKSVEEDEKKILKLMSQYENYHEQFSKVHKKYNLDTTSTKDKLLVPLKYLEFTPEIYHSGALSDAISLKKRLDNLESLRNKHAVMGELISSLNLKLLNAIDEITHQNKLKHLDLIKNLQNLRQSILNSKQQFLSELNDDKIKYASIKMEMSAELQRQLDGIIHELDALDKEIGKRETHYDNNFKSKQTQNQRIYLDITNFYDLTIEKSFNDSRLFHCCSKILRGYTCNYSIKDPVPLCEKYVANLKIDAANLNFNQQQKNIIVDLYNKTLYNPENDLAEISLLRTTLDNSLQMYSNYRIEANNRWIKIHNNHFLEVLRDQLDKVKANHDKFNIKYQTHAEKFVARNKTMTDRLVYLNRKMEPILKDCDSKKAHFQNETDTARNQTNHIKNLFSNRFIEQSLDSIPSIEHTFTQYNNEIAQGCNNVSSLFSQLKNLQSNYSNITNKKKQFDIKKEQVNVLLISNSRQMKDFSSPFALITQNSDHNNVALKLEELSNNIIHHNNTLSQMKQDMKNFEVDIDNFFTHMENLKIQLKTQAKDINQIFDDYTSDAPEIWEKLRQIENFASKLKFRSDKLAAATNTLHSQFSSVKSHINSAHDYLSMKLKQTKNETDIDLSKLTQININFFVTYYNQIVETVDKIKTIFSYQLPALIQQQHQSLLEKYQNYTNQFAVTRDTVKQFYHQKQIYYITEFHKHNSFVANLEVEMKNLIFIIDETKQNLSSLEKDETDPLRTIDDKTEEINISVSRFTRKANLFDPSINDYLQHLPDDLFVIDMEFSNILGDHLNLTKNILLTLESKHNKTMDSTQKNPLPSNLNDIVPVNPTDNHNKSIHPNDKYHTESNVYKKIWVSGSVILGLIFGSLFLALFLHYRQRRRGERELYNRCSHIYQH